MVTPLDVLQGLLLQGPLGLHTVRVHGRVKGTQQSYDRV